MPHIVLTEEQTRVVVGAGGVVEVRDPHNQPVASLTPFSPEDLEASARCKANGGKQAPTAEPITTRPSEVNPEEAAGELMELPWSKARHKIRAAARAYSEQTHVDY